MLAPPPAEAYPFVVGVHVLIVAHKTAATPALLAAVRERAEQERCRFTLLVPREYWDPDSEAAAATIELAAPLLDQAAGAHVETMVGATDPFEAFRSAPETGSFDEVLISTLPQRVSHWLRRDLPSRVGQLGLPVTVVTARSSAVPGRREDP
jgi:hypothetical protein